MKQKKLWLSLAAALLTVTLLTVVVYRVRQHYQYIHRDRVIILAYETNITGSDGEHWAQEMRTIFPELPDFEVGAYLEKQADADMTSMTIRDGWSQIVTRLANHEGDLLLLSEEAFRNMRDLGYLLPLTDAFYGDRAVFDGDRLLGVRVNGTTAEGLRCMDEMSRQVGLGQLLPIASPAEDAFEPVIACVYQGSRHAEAAQKILSYYWGGEPDET